MVEFYINSQNYLIKFCSINILEKNKFYNLPFPLGFCHFFFKNHVSFITNSTITISFILLTANNNENDDNVGNDYC